MIKTFLRISLGASLLFFSSCALTMGPPKGKVELDLKLSSGEWQGSPVTAEESESRFLTPDAVQVRVLVRLDSAAGEVVQDKLLPVVTNGNEAQSTGLFEELPLDRLIWITAQVEEMVSTVPTVVSSAESSLTLGSANAVTVQLHLMPTPAHPRVTNWNFTTFDWTLAAGFSHILTFTPSSVAEELQVQWGVTLPAGVFYQIRNSQGFKISNSSVTPDQKISFLPLGVEPHHLVFYNSLGTDVVLTVEQTQAAPAAPVGLFFEYVGASLMLNWTNVSGTATGYRVYRDGANISGDLAFNTTTFTDNTPPEGVPTFYSVVAFNGAGESAPLMNSVTPLGYVMMNMPFASAPDVGLKPLFVWDTVVGANVYELYVSANPGDISSLSPSALKYTGSVPNYNSNEILNTNQSYYWTVAAVDNTSGLRRVGSQYSFSTRGPQLYVSTNGSDTNSGSQNFPLRFVATALAQAVDGDHIYIEQGDYLEDFPPIGKILSITGSYSLGANFAGSPDLQIYPTTLRTLATGTLAATLSVQAGANLMVNSVAIRSGEVSGGNPTHALYVAGGGLSLNDSRVEAGLPSGTLPASSSYGLRLVGSSTVTVNGTYFELGSGLYSPNQVYGIHTSNFGGSLTVDGATFGPAVIPPATSALRYEPVVFTGTGSPQLTVRNSVFNVAAAADTSPLYTILSTVPGAQLTLSGNDIREVINVGDGGGNSAIRVAGAQTLLIDFNTMNWVFGTRDIAGNHYTIDLAPGTYATRPRINANRIAQGGTTYISSGIRLSGADAIVTNNVIYAEGGVTGWFYGIELEGSLSAQSFILGNTLAVNRNTLDSFLIFSNFSGGSPWIANNLFLNLSGVQGVTKLSPNAMPLLRDKLAANVFWGPGNIHSSYTQDAAGLSALNSSTFAVGNQVANPYVDSFSNWFALTGSTPSSVNFGGSPEPAPQLVQDILEFNRVLPLSIGAYQTANVSKVPLFGIRGEWRLDGSFFQSIADYDLTPTVVGTPLFASNRYSQGSQALALDGSLYATSSGSGVWNPNSGVSGGISVSFWAQNFNSLNDGSRFHVFSLNNKARFYFFSGATEKWFGLQSGSNVATTPLASESGDLMAIPGFNPANWNHFVMTIDLTQTTGNIRTYVNGDLVKVTDSVGRWDNAASHFPYLIGEPPLAGFPNARYSGNLDDLRFYERVLTPEEVWLLKNE